MKQSMLTEKLDAILALIPSETQIHVSLRYAGLEELVRKIGEVREKLTELRNESQK